MRSDRDKRTETEKEIDDFLSKFENPADEITSDIDTYLDEPASTAADKGKTFSWKKVDEADHAASKRSNRRSRNASNKKSSKKTGEKASDAKADSKKNPAAETKSDGKASTTKKPAKKKKKVRKKKPTGKAATKAAAAVKKVKSVDKKTLGQKLFCRKNKNGVYKFSFLMLLRDFVVL